MSSIIIRCCLAWAAVLGGTVCLWVVASAWLVTDPELRGLLPPDVYPPQSSDWIVATGQVDITDRGIHIQGPGESGETLLLINIARPIAVGELGRVLVHFSGQPDSLPYLIWSTQPQFQVSGMEPFALTEDGIATVNFPSMPNDPDQIYFVGLYQSGLSDPWTINSLALQPTKPGFMELQSMVLDRFFAHRSWRQQDINFSFDRPFGLRMAFAPILMTWVVCCAIILFAILKSHPTIWRQSVMVLVLCAWVVLDLRWSYELTQRGVVDPITLTQDIGTKEQAIEEVDLALMTFANQLHTNFSAHHFNRIYALGGDFESYRLRYHMSEWSVRALVPEKLPSQWPNRLEPNDLVLVVDPWDIIVSPRPSTGLVGAWADVASHGGVFLFTGEVLVSQNGFWAIRIGKDQKAINAGTSLGQP